MSGGDRLRRTIRRREPMAGRSCELRLNSGKLQIQRLRQNRFMAVPSQIHQQNYVSVATFRKNGVAVHTPVWFAEDNGKLYFMTSTRLGKYKRIRNNPNVTVAPCTIRGKITGPEFQATARILRPDEFERVRRMINAKYWLARVPLLWRNTDAYLEMTIQAKP